MRRFVSLAAAVALVSCSGGSGTPGTASTGTSASSPSSSTTTLGTTATSVDGETATTTTEADPYRFEVAVTGVEVTGGGDIEVPLGETVTLVVTADAVDELHVHGYDLSADLEPGVPTEISFEAAIPGTVEVELEDSGLVLFSLLSR